MIWMFASIIKIWLPLTDSPTFHGCTLVMAPVRPTQSQRLCAVCIHSESCLFIATTASLAPSAVEPVRLGSLLSHGPFPGAPQPQNKVMKTPKQRCLVFYLSLVFSQCTSIAQQTPHSPQSSSSAPPRTQQCGWLPLSTYATTSLLNIQSTNSMSS